MAACHSTVESRQKVLLPPLVMGLPQLRSGQQLRVQQSILVPSIRTHTGQTVAALEYCCSHR